MQASFEVPIAAHSIGNGLPKIARDSRHGPCGRLSAGLRADCEMFFLAAQHMTSLDLLGGQWADSNNDGMFGNSSVADNGGGMSASGNFFHGGYLNGHSNLGERSWRATNWGDAPVYANLGRHTSYAIPNRSGVGGASRIGGEGERSFRQISAGYV